MKTNKTKLNVSRLIQAGIFCGLLLCSLAVSANVSHSDDNTTNKTSEHSEYELPHQSTWSIVAEEEDVKLESWMYNTDDPLWQTVGETKEAESNEEDVKLESWMYQTDDPLWLSVIKAGEVERNDENVQVETWMTDPISWKAN